MSSALVFGNGAVAYIGDNGEQLMHYQERGLMALVEFCGDYPDAIVRFPATLSARDIADEFKRCLTAIKRKYGDEQQRDLVLSAEVEGIQGT